MKVIILSDVNSKSESIIPYGLRLARALECEADVLHVIDTRMQQAEYTSFSDSQSITPGETLSQDEIVQREKNRANLALDNLLSSETSRLNYPLKVNRLVKINNVEEELEQQAKENPENIFVISAEPDNYIFDSDSDILETVNSSKITAVLVPPGKKFRDFERVLVPVDFESKKFNAFKKIKFLFENFKVLVDAVSVAPKDRYLDAEAKAGTWKETATKYFLEQATLKTNVLEGDDFTGTVINYTEKNMHDMIILFEKKFSDSILKKTDIPVLVQFYD